MGFSVGQLKQGTGAWLFALALLLRALLPGGYMVAPAAAHSPPEIRLCGDPDIVGATAEQHRRGDPAPVHEPKRADHHCPFAFDGGATPPAAPARPAAHAAAPSSGSEALTAAPVALLAAAPPPPSTGPPALR